MTTRHRLGLLLVLPILSTALLSQQGHATSFRVNAETDSSTVISCRGGRCINCSNCHVGASKHEPALLAKYQYELAEGQKLKLGKTGYVIKEKGRLVIHDGKTRRVLPASTIILKDSEGRAAVYVTEVEEAR